MAEKRNQMAYLEILGGAHSFARASQQSAFPHTQFYSLSPDISLQVLKLDHRSFDIEQRYTFLTVLHKP